MGGLSIAEMHVYDDRHDLNIHDFDVLFLSGGHVPTQNVVFKSIHLKYKTHDFDGLDMVNDIALKDSFNEDIYALDDGVYVYKKHDKKREVQICGTKIDLPKASM